MNIRELAGINQNYYKINREERNYAAIFFAALCKQDNINRFLSSCGITEMIGDDFGIYFEYAYLRDLWNEIEDTDEIRANDAKKAIIRNSLKIKGIDDILNSSTKEINSTFGVAGAPSKDKIQFPGMWSIKKYHQNFQYEDDLLTVSKFKWSFNIKPDIVIHINKTRAVCIEAKYESGEGKYPSSEEEIRIFNNRGFSQVKQTALQEYMMEELLGINSTFIFLVKKKVTSETHKQLFWKEAFDNLDISDMPRFAIEMINNAAERNQ